MHKAALFKLLQRKNKYRNSNCIIQLSDDVCVQSSEYINAMAYIKMLTDLGIKYTYPGHDKYPRQLLKSKEPPLFLEYIGEPVWLSFNSLSVVGSRNIESLTEAWLKNNLTTFLEDSTETVTIVSGGAIGVDQFSHLVAIKSRRPTIFVLPSGLLDMYPRNLEKFKAMSSLSPMCFLSEFETTQQIHKSHFYFRNRIIAALGEMTLVAQASLKSGSLLTVHHCLENGKPVLSVPAHPLMHGFAGNIKLIQEGAFIVSNFHDLHEIWKAETRPQLSFV